MFKLGLYSRRNLSKQTKFLRQPKEDGYGITLPLSMQDLKKILSELDKDNWSCDWLSVNNLISLDLPVMTSKNMNKLSPESLQNKFELRSRH